MFCSYVTLDRITRPLADVTKGKNVHFLDKGGYGTNCFLEKYRSELGSVEPNFYLPLNVSVRVNRPNSTNRANYIRLVPVQWSNDTESVFQDGAV